MSARLYESCTSSPQFGTCRPVPQSNGTCAPEAGRFTSLQDVVDDYIRKHRARAERELAFYARKNLSETIKFAVLSELPDGTLHIHQRHIGREKLAALEPHLQAVAEEFARCRSFHELYEFCKRTIDLTDPRPLLPYDVATRIGAYLRLEPERIYLHCGTAEGAKNLGLKHHREYLEQSELPAPFQALSPREIEDCLCIYKDHFATINHSTASRRTPG